jgi:hypothetical protein
MAQDTPLTTAPSPGPPVAAGRDRARTSGR